MIKRFFSSKVQMDFEESASVFIEKSLAYRSKHRKGVVIVYDKNHNVSDMLRNAFLDEEEKTDVFRFSDCQAAKDFISRIREENTKAVLINGDLLGNTLNGSSLVGFLRDRDSDIPIWIYNCTNEKIEFVKKNTLRIGCISQKDGNQKILDAVGLKEHCQKQAIPSVGALVR